MLVRGVITHTCKQMQILLADNIRLHSENDELRSKLNALEQESMSFALGKSPSLLIEEDQRGV